MQREQVIYTVHSSVPFMKPSSWTIQYRPITLIKMSSWSILFCIVCRMPDSQGPSGLTMEGVPPGKGGGEDSRELTCMGSGWPCPLARWNPQILFEYSWRCWEAKHRIPSTLAKLHFPGFLECGHGNYDCQNQTALERTCWESSSRFFSPCESSP